MNIDVVDKNLNFKLIFPGPSNHDYAILLLQQTGALIYT